MISKNPVSLPKFKKKTRTFFGVFKAAEQMHTAHHFNNTGKRENRTWIMWCRCGGPPRKYTNRNLSL